MSQKIFCPNCLVEYASNVEQCEKCGRPLPMSNVQFPTTQQIGKQEFEQDVALPSIEHLGDLAKDTLVLLVNDEQEPVVLENVQEVILGRPAMEMPNEKTVDLTDYGGVSLGVSRRHVLISYSNGTFKVNELGSTNGTSLNGRFLPPGQFQQLRPYDQLVLGQLRLMVYFKTKESEQGKRIILTDRRPAQPSGLTLHYLNITIIPYIEALAEIQKIIRQIRNQPAEEIQVLYIQSGDRLSQIKLKLLMANEAIDNVRQWICPWQYIHAGPNLLITESTSKELMPQIHELVDSITDHLIVSYSETESLLLKGKLFEPISFIAMSGLELTTDSGND